VRGEKKRVALPKIRYGTQKRVLSSVITAFTKGSPRLGMGEGKKSKMRWNIIVCGPLKAGMQGNKGFQKKVLTKCCLSASNLDWESRRFRSGKRRKNRVKNLQESENLAGKKQIPYQYSTRSIKGPKRRKHGPGGRLIITKEGTPRVKKMH